VPVVRCRELASRRRLDLALPSLFPLDERPLRSRRCRDPAANHHLTYRADHPSDRRLGCDVFRPNALQRSSSQPIPVVATVGTVAAPTRNLNLLTVVKSILTGITPSVLPSQVNLRMVAPSCESTPSRFSCTRRGVHLADRSHHLFALLTTASISDCISSGARQRWTVQRGSTSVRLAGTDYCMDAGENPSNGVKAKIWTVSFGCR
jgi:hypothetical protein